MANATPTNKLKTIICIILSSAIALTILVGKMSIKASPKDVPAVKLTATPSGKGICNPIPGWSNTPIIIANATATKVVSKYKTIVLPPMRPNLVTSSKLLTPTTILVNTKGTIIIFSNRHNDLKFFNDNKVIIRDSDDNRYEIEDIDKLDKRSWLLLSSFL